MFVFAEEASALVKMLEGAAAAGIYEMFQRMASIVGEHRCIFRWHAKKLGQGYNCSKEHSVSSTQYSECKAGT